MSTIGQYGSESDPRAYRFDGELNVANRGVMEFIEMLKCDEKFLYGLLTLSQEQVPAQTFTRYWTRTRAGGTIGSGTRRRMGSPMLMLAIDIAGRRAVLVGGGGVAERKARTLLAAGAEVRVVSPVLSEGLQALRGSDRLEVLHRPFRAGDTAGAWLVVAATGSAEVDGAVAAEARQSGALLCVPGMPELGDVHFPAEIQRGPVTIGIATGGASPALARKLRQQVEAQVGPEYGLLAELLAGVRERLKTTPDRPQADRARLYASLVEGPVLGLLARGELKMARDEVDRAVWEWLD